MKTEEVNSSLSSSHHFGKVLIEDDGENGCGKGRIGKIIHRPAKDLAVFDSHGSEDQMGRLGDSAMGRSLRFASPYLPISSSP